MPLNRCVFFWTHKKVFHLCGRNWQNTAFTTKHDCFVSPKKYIIRSQILLKFILAKHICVTFWNKSTSHVQTWISLRYNDHSRRNTRKDWVYLEVKSKRTGSIERHCFCHNCLLHVLLIQITLSIIHFDDIIHHKIYQIRKIK